MIRNLLQLFRSLRRSPASAAAAVLTLALTLGAGTTIFAIVDAVLLTPPSIADPDALMTLGETPVAAPGAPRMISYPTFEAWRERAGSLATLAAFDVTNLTLTGLGAAERIGATDVDSQFLPLLGVTPALGRLFRPEDVGQALAIVNHEFWQTRLGADREVIGRTIVLNGRAHQIIGILPESFRFALTDPIWRPLPFTAAQAATNIVPHARIRPATDRFDLLTAVAAAAVLLLVGLSAVLPAARRAARTDPLARSEPTRDDAEPDRCRTPRTCLRSERPPIFHAQNIVVPLGVGQRLAIPDVERTKRVRTRRPADAPTDFQVHGIGLGGSDRRRLETVQ